MDKTSPCNNCTRCKDPETCAMFRTCYEYRTWLRTGGWPGKKGTSVVEKPKPQRVVADGKHCIVCGKEIPGGRYLYCSEECKSKKALEKVSICATCGKILPEGKRKYCCELCRLQAKRKRELEASND